MTELSTGEDESDVSFRLEKNDNGGVYKSDNKSDGSYCGHIYTNVETGEDVYVSFRQHIYRKLKSYPLSTSIIRELKNRGISKVYIFDYEQNLYVFDLSVYENAKKIEHADAQRAPSIEQGEQYNVEGGFYNTYEDLIEV